MSYYSDVDDYKEENFDVHLYLDLNWEELQDDGYIWEDINCNRYKEKDIDNRYLKNILNFCKHHYRPKEQVEKLQQLAVDRGFR